MDWPYKRVLVTGGAGFIGSHLTEALLSLGSQVFVLDNLSTGVRKNIPEKAIFIPGDLLALTHDHHIRDRIKVEADGDIDVVFHLAALNSVPRSFDQPNQFFLNNVHGTYCLIDFAKQFGAKRILFASSSSVYGGSDEPLLEEHTLRPKSPYAASKALGERVLDYYADVEVATLRLFNVYGPRQRDNTRYAAVVPIFRKQLTRGNKPTVYGDGRQRRDFTYVGDVVEAFVKLALRHEQRITVNVARGADMSVLDLLQTMQEILGTGVVADFLEERKGDVRTSQADVRRLSNLFTWNPLDLREGLKRTLLN